MKRAIVLSAALSILVGIVGAANNEHVYIPFNEQEQHLLRSGEAEWVMLGTIESQLFKSMSDIKAADECSSELGQCVQACQRGIRLIPRITLERGLQDLIITLSSELVASDELDQACAHIGSLFSVGEHYQVGTNRVYVCRAKNNEGVFSRQEDILPQTRARHDILVGIAMPGGKHVIIGDLIVTGDVSVEGAMSVISKIIATIIAASTGHEQEKVRICSGVNCSVGQNIDTPIVSVENEHFQGELELGEIEAGSQGNAKGVTFSFASNPETGAYVKVIITAAVKQANDSRLFCKEYYFPADGSSVAAFDQVASGGGKDRALTTLGSSGPGTITIHYQPDVDVEHAVLSYKLIARNVENPALSAVVSSGAAVL